MSWSDALKTFCAMYYGTNHKARWILVGSAASVLQGAEMEPNDIDIYTNSLEDVAELSNLMGQYHQERPSSYPLYHKEWFSSITEPYRTETYPSGFSWTKGRWRIGTFPLEVVHISDSGGIPDSVDGDGIWEGGRYIWPYAKQLSFFGYTVPVVPLEIQLESNLRRSREDRARKIAEALKKYGCDEALLAKAISVKHQEHFRRWFIRNETRYH